MMIGCIGRKIGMTRIFDDSGRSFPATVVEVLPNKVTQIKTEEKDGYSALQVTTGTRKASRVNKPLTGHFAKAKVEAGRGLWEFRLPEAQTHSFSVGSEITVDLFKPGQKIDATSTSKGKGFQGAVKRHNFRTQDATHGNSLSHRAPGSIGQNQSPGKVFKGKKMAGHMGDRRCTIQNLKVLDVNSERNYLLVHGAIPGAPGNDIILKPAVKVRDVAAKALEE
ncbi:MAG TPA: 50S ribosomal protein L3 [Gammaproteobacteria bacterium]|nr:50S ribosomal protein L3 [Gammaproteobacteria bacterium]